MSGQLNAGMDPRTIGTGGLTGVWAEENTRASIFEAMQRKETFGVSGPHIKVRLFGGWEYTADMLADQGLGEDGLREGRADGRRPAAGQGQGADVPGVGGEGSDLRQPRPHPDRQGLDQERPELREDLRRRLGGRPQARQMDGCGAADRQHGRRRECHVHQHDRRGGAEEGVDGSRVRPDVHAFYYARVLEIPTPRWTTIQAKKLGVAPPDVVPATLQERAWSSPIWYTPSAEARKNAKPGITVADLKKKGAAALNDAQLKALIVEKSTWLQNNVTGDKYQIVYGASGKGASGKPATPVEPGYVTEQFAANQGQSSCASWAGISRCRASSARDRGELSRRRRAVLHQQRQDRHRARRHADRDHRVQDGGQVCRARSNEFGYANYEIIPAVAELNPLREPCTRRECVRVG